MASSAPHVLHGRLAQAAAGRCKRAQEALPDTMVEPDGMRRSVGVGLQPDGEQLPIGPRVGVQRGQPVDLGTWPLLFWRMQGVHPAATLIVCLITVVHTTLGGFGIAALGFIAVTGELTNTSRVTALSCGIAGLLPSIGVVSWRLNNWRTPQPKRRPVSALAAWRRLPLWQKAIFVVLVTFIATIVVERDHRPKIPAPIPAKKPSQTATNTPA